MAPSQPASLASEERIQMPCIMQPILEQADELAGGRIGQNPYYLDLSKKESRKWLQAKRRICGSTLVLADSNSEHGSCAGEAYLAHLSPYVAGSMELGNPTTTGCPAEIPRAEKEDRVWGDGCRKALQQVSTCAELSQ
eukprot:scaffold2178_cov52-Prasinocladus_malaysianus.AAC.1